nr:LptA/OstA family protein [Pyrinomonadaceae bacterium]
RTTEISANELNASFNENNSLQTANALGNGNAVLIPAKVEEFTKVTLSAPNAIHLNFKGAGLLDQMQTEGRTTVLLNAPNNSADAANKKLTADSVKTVFAQNGKDLAKAEAVGNAELFIEPLRYGEQNYKTTLNAPRFDCEFFPTGNNAKNCVAATKTKTVRVPTMPNENRGTQTLLADRLNAIFNQQTQDIQQMDASGNTKFSELDRNGIAENITFTANDEVVRLRGGEPTVWDSQARVKANEIDWNTRADVSNLRGNVSTTYYSQKQTGGATPFGQTSKPVFLTAETAEFNHRLETGIYTGNARAWQENNYVRADKLTIQQKQGQLNADGNVQSVLYNAKRKENGKETEVPVYASSQNLIYNRNNRILKYENDVDIRQGTDRIVGGVANIYLNEKNDVSQTIVERNVVITQPNRKAVGDYAQYNASDEIVTLRGNPARVDDAENGSSQGGQMMVYLRDKRVVAEGKSKENSNGRIRSVYKVKNN